MKKFFLLSALFFLLSGCANVRQSEDKRLTYEVTSEYAAKVEKEMEAYSYDCNGVKEGKIEQFCQDFIMYKKFTLEEARQVYMDLLKGFEDEINNKVALRKYLAEYPVTYKNTEVTLLFKDKDTKEVVHDPYIAYVSLFNRGDEAYIEYIMYNDEKKMFCNHYKETYEQALYIVQQDSNIRKITTKAKSSE